MAEYAWRRGWRDAALATDTVIDYFKNVVQAFEARWRQLGGKVVAEESYQSSPTGSPDPASSQNAVNRLKDVDADVIVTATAPPWGAMVPILTGLRTLGVKTPMINSWAGDGSYWLPKNSPVTDYYFVTYASVFGDDPLRIANAGEGVEGRRRQLHHRPSRDRRRRHRDQAGEVDAGPRARGADGEVP